MRKQTKAIRDEGMMSAQHVRLTLRASIDHAGITDSACADMIGISKAYLSDVLRGRRDPGPAILKFLGLVKFQSPPVYQRDAVNK